MRLGNPGTVRITVRVRRDRVARVLTSYFAWNRTLSSALAFTLHSGDQRQEGILGFTVVHE